MILRRVNKDFVEHFIDLGDEFQIAQRRSSPSFFEESAKGHFGNMDVPETVFAMILPKYDHDIPLYADDVLSIMSNDGKFFKRLAFNS